MAYPFPRPPTIPLRLGRGASGFGVFAGQDIPRGRFLLEYWGKVIPSTKADTIGGRYLFDLGNGNTVAGASRKNLARYVNHACKPNAEVRIVGNRIYLYTKKRIRAGEELTYDYGKEYVDVFIKPYGCRCSSCIKKRARRSE